MAEKVLVAWVGLGREVRRQRQRAGLSQAQLALRIHLSPAMVGAIERATRAPKREQVAEMDSLFATEGALLRRWSECAREDANPDWHNDVVRSEVEASEIRMWHPTLIPGILQTGGYARSIFSAGRPLDTPEEIEELVASRLARFPTLSARLWCVLDEVALRRVIGGPEVMSRQLAHLYDLAQSGAVRIQVVPPDTSAHPGLSGGFRIISFRERPPVVYVEHFAGGVLIDGGIEVSRLSAVYGELQAWARTPRSSLAVIKDAKEQVDALA